MPLDRLRDAWVLLVGMGIALSLLGLAAIASSFIATMAAVLVFGILLVLAAIFQVFTAFWGRPWRGFILHLLAGVLYLIAGVFMIDNPEAAALALTLMVAACLLVGGILRIILSVAERFDGWGWVCLNGIVSVLLGNGHLEAVAPFRPVGHRPVCGDRDAVQRTVVGDAGVGCADHPTDPDSDLRNKRNGKDIHEYNKFRNSQTRAP